MRIPELVSTAATTFAYFKIFLPDQPTRNCIGMDESAGMPTFVFISRHHRKLSYFLVGGEKQSKVVKTKSPGARIFIFIYFNIFFINKKNSSSLQLQLKRGAHTTCPYLLYIKVGSNNRCCPRGRGGRRKPSRAPNPNRHPKANGRATCIWQLHCGHPTTRFWNAAGACAQLLCRAYMWHSDGASLPECLTPSVGRLGAGPEQQPAYLAGWRRGALNLLPNPRGLPPYIHPGRHRSCVSYAHSVLRTTASPVHGRLAAFVAWRA